MSAPEPQVLHSVQQLANWFARLAGRGEEPDPEGATFQRLTQGLGAAEVAEALDYAQRAETLRQQLLAAPPGTQLYQLPGYAALGTRPVVSILHDFVEQITDEEGAEKTVHHRPVEEFRGNAYFSLAFAEEEFASQGFEVPGSDVEGEYQGYDVEAILPFDLYA